MKSIDLNCDMGELPAAIADGTQASLMPFLTSVNVACGGHAGDERTMETTIRQALGSKLALGAHPGYPDPLNFGRVELALSAEATANSVCEQVKSFAKVAAACGARVSHVKPHGALYNQAARDWATAQAIAHGVARWSRDVILVGLAGSLMLDVFREAGFRVAAEGFADRRYEADGTLRSRRLPDALIRDPVEAGQQALLIANQGIAVACNGKEIVVNAQTICIHGDTAEATEMAATVARTLRQSGITLQALTA
jgi:UPF0271 protein